MPRAPESPEAPAPPAEDLTPYEAMNFHLDRAFERLARDEQTRVILKTPFRRAARATELRGL